MAFLRTATPGGRWVPVASALIPLAIIGVILYDFQIEENPDDKVVYADIMPTDPNNALYKQWQADRAERGRQAYQEQQRQEKAKQQSFKRLADQLGIDTSK